MALSPFSPQFRNFFFDDFYQDASRFDQSIQPYWLKSWDAVDQPATMTKTIDDKRRFGVNLDVSLYKPEELKLSLDGHTLTCEGHHEIKDQDQYLMRTFTRKWTLPEECDLTAVHSMLSKDGHLFIEAPKIGAPRSKMIKIERGSSR